MTAWDPVGTGDAAEAWDEYDDYHAGIAHRLRDIADTEEAAQSVSEYLSHIERDHMGDDSNAFVSRNARLAEGLVAWHEWSYRRGAGPPREWIHAD